MILTFKLLKYHNPEPGDCQGRFPRFAHIPGPPAVKKFYGKFQIPCAALYETILKLKDLEECRRFFEDLCTPTELQAMEQRFDVAVYLQQGLVYLDILEKTGASSATISRVRRSMLENGAGGVVRSIIVREGLDQKT